MVLTTSRAAPVSVSGVFVARFTCSIGIVSPVLIWKERARARETRSALRTGRVELGRESAQLRVVGHAFEKSVIDEGPGTGRLGVGPHFGHNPADLAEPVVD